MRLIAGTLALCTLVTTASAQSPATGPQRYAPPDMRAIASGLADYTDTLLFGEIWKRSDLAPRDRSLITVAALITNGDAGQLGAHVSRALDNGVTPRELSEIITHLAFYAGWPKAVTAIGIVKGVFDQRGIKPEDVAAEGPPPPAPDRDADKERDAIIENDGRAVASPLAGYTSKILFSSLWRRPGLAARDRSLVTIAALIAEGRTDQLAFYIDKGMRNGLTRVEISEAITHLAFYVGWPRAMSAAQITIQGAVTERRSSFLSQSAMIAPMPTNRSDGRHRRLHRECIRSAL
jgi:4-carboxymuconolactone decarboxylase